MLTLNKKGFTLIELLVVIAIIGILSSIVLVSLNSARAKANAAKVAGDASQMMTAFEMAQADGVATLNVGAITVNASAGAACPVAANNTLNSTSSNVTYLKLPCVPSPFVVTVANGNSPTAYSITVTGFASGNFICSGGSCSCDVAGGCIK